MSHYASKPLCRTTNLVIQEYGGEILIYDLTLHKAFSLNETSALVWQICDGNKTIGEISRQLSRPLKTIVSEDFVWLALEQLKKENLLEEDSSIISNPFDGLSRREVIRKVGLASLVALPAIAGLVAPTAAHAQSGGCFGNNNAGQSALGCTCDSLSDCASGCCGRSEALANICVTPALDGTGSVCRAGCECISNCCVGNLCHPGDLPAGSPCTTTCQCLNTCVANLCT
jgi:hypothetical protein